MHTGNGSSAQKISSAKKFGTVLTYLKGTFYVGMDFDIYTIHRYSRSIRCVQQFGGLRSTGQRDAARGRGQD